MDFKSGVWYWGVADRVKHYRKLADAMSGKTGTLVALLPERAAFALDPQDEGRFAAWYRADWNAEAWRRVTTAKPFYLQGPADRPYMAANGYPYLGAMWYQFKVDVPAVPSGRAVRLHVPVVEAEAWLWVNGQYIGHRPYWETYVRPNPMEEDVTAALRPGASNVITLRVSTSLNRTAVASGLLSRAFLYSPVEVAPAAEKPDP